VLNALKFQKEWRGRESLPCRRLLRWSVSVLGEDQWRRPLLGTGIPPSTSAFLPSVSSSLVCVFFFLLCFSTASTSGVCFLPCCFGPLWWGEASFCYGISGKKKKLRVPLVSLCLFSSRCFFSLRLSLFFSLRLCLLGFFVFVSCVFFSGSRSSLPGFFAFSFFSGSLLSVPAVPPLFSSSFFFFLRHLIFSGFIARDLKRLPSFTPATAPEEEDEEGD